MQVPQATQLSVITCAIILLVFKLRIKIIYDVTTALGHQNRLSLMLW